MAQTRRKNLLQKTPHT